MGARILNVTEDQYHADPCDSPSLSHSLAHTLVTESPRHAWLAHPRLGGVARRRTKAMDNGAITHSLLLGKGAEFEMVKANDWRTNAAKDARTAIEESGKIAILGKDFEKLMTAAERIAKNCADQGFPLNLAGAEAEVSIEFTEDVEGAAPVLCRCRMDMMRLDHVMYDVKTVDSANPRDIEKRIVEYGMDIQHVAYTRAYEQLRPESAGRTDFVFLFCETAPPYEVVPARLDGIFREVGMRRWGRGVRLWRQLLDEGSWPWPGYCDGAILLQAPVWVINQEMAGETL